MMHYDRVWQHYSGGKEPGKDLSGLTTIIPTVTMPDSPAVTLALPERVQPIDLVRALHYNLGIPEKVVIAFL